MKVGMDFRVKRVNQVLRGYDRTLYAFRDEQGVIQVFRKAETLSSSMLPEELEGRIHPHSQFLFALTDNWKLDGKPVEMGLDPLMRQLQSMDSWTKDAFFAEMKKLRERRESEKAQSQKNEIRARAYDLRKEFAQATNEINTSSLSKTDPRVFKEK